MKEIELTQGYTAIVDDEDYERAARYCWCACANNSVCPMAWVDGKFVTLGKFLLHLEDSRVDVGFMNHDRCDFRKSNLKTMDRSERQSRRKKSSGKSSKYKGVCWGKRVGKWIATFHYKGRYRYLGRFAEEKDAALAYDEALVQQFGEHARFNFPNEMPDRLIHSCVSSKTTIRTRKGRFRGVTYDKTRDRWHVCLQVNHKRYQKYAKSEIEAAHIYDQLAIKYLGKNARVNFPVYRDWKNQQSERKHWLHSLK